MSDKKSKYYYDYTRNMSDEQIKNKNCNVICNNPNCKCETKPFDTNKWKESLRNLNKSKFETIKDKLKGYAYWLTL